MSENTIGWKYQPVTVLDDGKQYPDYSEMGQANVFVNQFRSLFRYSEQYGILWHDGQRWVSATRYATEMYRFLTEEQYKEAHVLKATAYAQYAESIRSVSLEARAEHEATIKAHLKDIEKQADAYIAFSRKMRDASKARAVLDLACNQLEQVYISDLDKTTGETPYLLNTPDGTYDLRTGKKNPFRKEDYITKMTSCSPNERGKETWDRFIYDAFDGDQATIAYAQQIAGMCAIGHVKQECLIIAVGKGGNGKSTFFDTIAHVLSNQDGDSAHERGVYADSVSSSLLVTNGNSDWKRFEKEHLRGLRLAIASELEEGQRLDSQCVKELCSTGNIPASIKYKQGNFSFPPSHHIVLYTNHLPRVSSRDWGTWRRIFLLPFNHTFAGAVGEKKNYTQYLLETCSGYILQWVMDGARAYIQNEENLEKALPPSIKAEMEAYRRREDWLYAFFLDKCEVDPSDRTKKTRAEELYLAYEEYATAKGDHVRTRNMLKAELANEGIYQHRDSKGFYYEGIALLPVTFKSAVFTEIQANTNPFDDLRVNG